MSARLIALLLAAVFLSACAATCPFNIPVVTLPPHQAGGFSWGTVIRPMGDACMSTIAIEPTNAAAWYAGGPNGLYMTKNGGQNWTHPLTGQVDVILVVPGNPLLVYAGVGNKVYLSRDNGQIWTAIATFSDPVRSLLVANGTLYTGLAWSSHAVPSGVYTSNLGGGFLTFHPFGAGQTGLIVWTLSRDALSGMLYAGTEIFDHPQPYHPPFFRSPNSAVSWTDVAGTLPWHVVASAVRPADGYVYALTEGAGLFGSANQGGSWIPPGNSIPPSVSLLMDPKQPTRLFGGRQKFGTMNGGIFVSTDEGKTFVPIGLDGVTVGGVATDGGVTKIYAAAYASGIYVSPVP